MFFVDAVRMNALTTGTTNRMVEEKIKAWLRQARDRAGGRKRRYLQAQSQTRQKRSQVLLEDIDTDVEDSLPSSDTDK